MKNGVKYVFVEYWVYVSNELTEYFDGTKWNRFVVMMSMMKPNCYVGK